MTAEPSADADVLMSIPDAELDLLTCPGWRGELTGALDRGDCKVLIVDLSGVTFFGATALGVLVDVSDRAAWCDVELRLIVCSHTVSRPLELMGLAGHFAIYDTRADALTGGEPQMR